MKHKWDGRATPEGYAVCSGCGCRENEHGAEDDCPCRESRSPQISETDFLLLIMAVKEHLNNDFPPTFQYLKQVFDGLVKKYNIEGA